MSKSECPFYHEIRLKSEDEQDLWSLIEDRQIAGLYEEDNGLVGYIHRGYVDKIMTILNMWAEEHIPVEGERIYVGGLGDAIVTSNTSYIEAFLVFEDNRSQEVTHPSEFIRRLGTS